MPTAHPLPRGEMEPLKEEPKLQRATGLLRVSCVGSSHRVKGTRKQLTIWVLTTGPSLPSLFLPIHSYAIPIPILSSQTAQSCGSGVRRQARRRHVRVALYAGSSVTFLRQSDQARRQRIPTQFRKLLTRTGCRWFRLGDSRTGTSTRAGDGDGGSPKRQGNPRVPVHLPVPAPSLALIWKVALFQPRWRRHSLRA